MGKKITAPVSTRTDKKIKSECYNNLTHSNYNISDDENTRLTFGIEHREAVENIQHELTQKFQPKKNKTYPLADCYFRIGEDRRAERVINCGTYLEFVREDNSSSCKLNSANFCRDRLCPMCSWRRTYKIYGQVSRVMDVIENDYEFIFLTLTVPNVKSSDLPKKIDDMQKAFKQMIQFDKRIKKICAGYFKALEVTHNKNRYSKSFDTYHPHFHVIIAVHKGYFSGADYIRQSDWLSIWRRVMHDNSITQVDVRKCKNVSTSESEQANKSISSAVAEVAKYAVKDSDYLIPWSQTLTDSSVKTFLSSLASRRLVSFGGIFYKVKQQLKLDDVEDGDLVHVDGYKLRNDVALQIYRWGWSCGAYKLIAVEKKESVLIEYDEEN